MRLVKLSTDQFPEETDLLAFFDQKLPARNPPGLFRFAKRRIAEGSLAPGETVLFSYRGHLRFIAQTKTGRMDNVYMPHPDYPCCFIMNLQTLRRANVALAELESPLRTQAGLKVSLGGRGWTRIPDGKRTELVIAALGGR
jgi:hypothetical protein